MMFHLYFDVSLLDTEVVYQFKNRHHFSCFVFGWIRGRDDRTTSFNVSYFHGNHLSCSISKTYFHQRFLYPSDICSHRPISYSSLSASRSSPFYISENYFKTVFVYDGL